MLCGMHSEMHAYSTDESRVKAYGVIAVVAVVFAWTILIVASHFDWPQWLVSVPSLAATYAATYGIFDRWLWRCSIMRSLGLVTILDVSGDYDGRLISTYKDGAGNPVT